MMRSRRCQSVQQTGGRTGACRPFSEHLAGDRLVPRGVTPKRKKGYMEYFPKFLCADCDCLQTVPEPLAFCRMLCYDNNGNTRRTQACNLRVLPVSRCGAGLSPGGSACTAQTAGRICTSPYCVQIPQRQSHRICGVLPQTFFLQTNEACFADA